MDALRQRLSVLSERYLAERLGIGLRTLRRSFLDERGVTAYVALRQLRLQEAQRRITTQPDLTLKPAAQQCGFGHYAGSAAIAAAPVMHAVLPEKSKHLRKSALLVVIAAIKRSGRSHLLNTIVSAYIDCASDFNLICIVEFLSRRNRVEIGRSAVAISHLAPFCSHQGRFELSQGMIGSGTGACFIAE